METPQITKGILSIDTEIETLIERIKLSNNGYLFAPSPAEIATAKANSNLFKYQFNPANSSFPHKIELKEKR